MTAPFTVTPVPLRLVYDLMTVFGFVRVRTAPTLRRLDYVPPPRNPS